MASFDKTQGLWKAGTKEYSFLWQGSNNQKPLEVNLQLGSVQEAWTQVITIEPLSMEEWVRKKSKFVHSVSILYKATILSFPLVGNWLVWDRVRAGKNPWVGCGDSHILPLHLIQSCRVKGSPNLSM